MQAKTRLSRRLQVSFRELRHIIGSKWPCLGSTVSWSPGRHLAGRISVIDCASEELPYVVNLRTSALLRPFGYRVAYRQYPA